jgi:GDP-D-mannose dehydratase
MSIVGPPITLTPCIGWRCTVRGTTSSWQAHVETAAEFLRPSDRAAMAGDATKAGAVLGWYPTFGFDEVVTAMVSSDLEQEQHTCL